MIFWSVNCLFTFLLCVFFAGIIIPQILLVAFRKKLFDVPDERKIHQCAVPRLGGIAFKPVIFFSLALLAGINFSLGHPEMPDELGKNADTLFFGYCAIQLLYLTGMSDDLIGIRYKAKFVIQILCGMMLIAGGVWLDDFHGVLWIHRIPAWAGYPLTILLTVFIINAINLIDGIDGLASGLCGIACLFFGLAFFALQEYIYALIAFASFGVLVPFFYYNVFGNPEKRRKIFMGDTGSLTIGMILCILSVKLVSVASASTSHAVNSMVLAFSPLFVPCCDVVRVYLHRVRNGKNPFLPDKNHIHHKLLAIGMRQRAAMVTIISFSLLFTLCNLWLSMHVEINLLLVADVMIWTVANIWLTHKIFQINRKL